MKTRIKKEILGPPPTFRTQVRLKFLGKALSPNIPHDLPLDGARHQEEGFQGIPEHPLKNPSGLSLDGARDSVARNMCGKLRHYGI